NIAAAERSLRMTQTGKKRPSWRLYWDAPSPGPSGHPLPEGEGLARKIVPRPPGEGGAAKREPDRAKPQEKRRVRAARVTVPTLPASFIRRAPPASPKLSSS